VFLTRTPVAVSVSVSPSPPAAGQPATLIATVRSLVPGAGVPAGTVRFETGEGGGPSAVLVGDPQSQVATATATITAPTGGTLFYTALYSGSLQFAAGQGSVSAPVQP
jgi:hypothetical protein